MHTTEEANGRAAAGSLERDARELAAGLAKRKYLVLLLLTAVYLYGAILHARAKPFWLDEVGTLILAGSPDVATTWKVAAQCDPSPPLPYVLTHFCIRWFGSGEIAARLPAILGFWIFCLCLFRFTLRRAGIYYALAALLLPIGTWAYSYAVEARGYGLELAFSGMALVAWQSAAERSRNWLACAGLALSLAAASLCHYYALLLYVPLAGGEAFRAWRERRFEWGIWAAFAAGMAPIVLQLAAFRGVLRVFTHPWSEAAPGQIFEFWETGLQHTLTVLPLLYVLVALRIVATRDQAEPADGAPPVRIPDHEWIAGVLFLAIPAICVAGGLLVTRQFTPRYALVALAGFVLLTVMIAAHLAGTRALFGFLLLAASTLPLGIVTIDNEPFRNPFDREPILQEALRREPVAIPDAHLFMQLWHYAPPALKSKLIFVADPASALEYEGTDNIDNELLVIRRLAPVPVVEYKDFRSPGKEFLVYQNNVRPEWVVAKIIADGGSAEVLRFAAPRCLLRVRLPR